MDKIDGLYLSDISKYIPKFNDLDPLLQRDLQDLVNKVKIFYDMDELDFLSIIPLDWASAGIVLTSNEEIEILLEVADPSIYTRYLFMTDRQKMEQGIELIENVIKQLAYQSGLFRKILDIVPEVVMEYGKTT